MGEGLATNVIKITYSNMKTLKGYLFKNCIFV